MPDNPNIPAGTDPVIAALYKQDPVLGQKILKLQETQQQLVESMANFNNGPK